MSKVEEIEKAVEQLPLHDFVQLAGWVERRRQELKVEGVEGVRNHNAFLSSYTPEDEGLYDDAAAG